MKVHAVKKKLTLLGVLKGEEAKVFQRSRNDFSIYYHGTKGKQRLETVEDRTEQKK